MIEQHLKTMIEAGVCSPIDHFLASNGVKFESLEMPSSEIKYLKSIGLCSTRHAPKECYYNSQKFALFDDRLQYCEGVAVGPVPIPLDHAWCVLSTDNGKLVIDLTWQLKFHARNRWYNNRVLGVIPKGWEYYGIEIDKAEVSKYWRKYEMSGPILPEILGKRNEKRQYGKEFKIS